jgi:cephalosporin-C deacetylase-like acetyl esterase
MFGKFGLAVAAVLISAAPAMAASSDCGSTPYAPAAVDGSKATEAQMKDAHDDVVNFIKSSDDYQACLYSDLDKQKAAAAKAKTPAPLDQGIIDGVTSKVAANQKTKEKVGAEYNAAVHAYKAAHPKG